MEKHQLSFCNVLTVHGNSDDIQNIIKEYLTREDDDFIRGYMFDIFKVIGESETNTYLENAKELLENIELLESPDFQDLTLEDKQGVYDYLFNAFEGVKTRLAQEGIAMTLSLQSLSVEGYRELFGSLIRFSPRITGYDVSLLLTDDYYTEDQIKLITPEEKDYFSFKPLTEEEIQEYDEDQVWASIDDNTIIFNIPTKYGPALEVAEELVYRFNVDVELLFGNGVSSGKVINKDNRLLMSAYEPDFKSLHDRLDHLGLFEWYCTKFGWKVEDEGNEELGNVIDMSTVPAFSVE